MRCGRGQQLWTSEHTLGDDWAPTFAAHTKVVWLSGRCILLYGRVEAQKTL